jgi:mono/diheme cytochrome c family protein
MPDGSKRVIGVIGVAVVFGGTALAGCMGGRVVGPIGTADSTGSGGSGPSVGGPGGTGIVEPPVGGNDGGVPTGTAGTQASTGRAGTGVISCSSGGTAVDGGVPMPTPSRGPLYQPNAGALVTAASAPPAVSGGTLRVLSNGQTAVAADPDRDRVYVVDLSMRAVSATVTLQAGDEPGRVIEDAAGRVHVALRHGGALVTFDPTEAQPALTRRTICASPRGLAYDPTGDLVHVACADGELVSVPAAGGAAVRTLQLERDLRDVIVQGSQLRLTRFRSGELLTVESDGTVSKKIGLPDFSAPGARGGQRFSAGAAWKMMPTADGGVAVLHQRGVADTIRPVTGGYGSTNPCDAIVHPAVTTVAADGTVKTGPALPGLVLAVDMAISPDGARVAVISAGNATNQLTTSTGPQLNRLYVTDMVTATDKTIGCKPDGTHGPCLAPMTTIIDMSNPSAQVPIMGCAADPKVYGQPIAVAFAGDGSVIVQSREPAMLALGDGTRIDLGGASRADTGHLLFHANAGGYMACGSCHLEGDDDGRVWDFGCDASGNAAGMRRTQSLQTGLRGTEPFHWNGDESSFDQLMVDVLVTRMSGPKLTTDQTNAMLTWIDAQPRPLRRSPSNPAAVQRGAALFSDTANVGCATCHAGARFSNNASMDVGTGRAFQVPSLLGVGTRGPFMHDGCAATLRDRFNPTCGGDRHGVTAQLTSAQIDDLIAYLNTL